MTRTNPSCVTAILGLARCWFQQGERAAAVTALQRVPASSSFYTRSQIEAARLLATGQTPIPPQVTDLQQASGLIHALGLT